MTEDKFQHLPFYVLGATKRFEIIEQLKQEGPQTQSELAKKLNSKPENIQGAKDFLINCNWIEEKNRKIQLTPLANNIYDVMMRSVNFMDKHKTKYFFDHDFGNMPEHFKQGIGVFEECDFMDNSMAIHLKENEILENSEKLSCNVLSDGNYSKERMETLVEKFKKCRPFSLRTILAKDAVIPEDKAESWRNQIDKIIEEYGGTRELRRLKDIMIQVVMNKKEAIVILPKLNDKKKKPDMSCAFYGKNNDFLQWCSDYFEHCWGKATPYSSHMNN